MALLGLAWLAAGCAAQARGGTVAVPPGGPARTVLNVPVKSLVELRFKNVVKQAYDLSCGAAALATIVNHYYGDPIAEQEVVDGAVALGDREKILRDGFSMLELKRFAERKGYVSAGYRLGSAEDLARLKVPVITLTNVRGYAHFVVIKGVVGGQVYIADPAFGNRSRSLRAFEREWNRVILVVLDANKQGNTAFITDGALKARPGEVTLLLDRALQTIAPRPGEFGLK
jgi:predicted double-glycine peptidase